MTEDARFEDADEAPMALRALDEGDLKVLAALVQDAVFPASEMKWDRRRRRFAVLLNRFRWEEAGRRPPERVRALLVIEDALKVASQGIDRDDPDLVLSLLTLTGRPARTARGASP
jgi:ketosteroid isomerase-like protein